MATVFMSLVKTSANFFTFHHCALSAVDRKYFYSLAITLWWIFWFNVQVFKICCNHFLTNNLTLKPMPGSGDKAWIWYAVDFSFENGKVVQLAVRFRDAETAACFKDVFDVAKEGFVSPSSDAVTTGDLQPIPQSEFPVAVTSDAVPICAGQFDIDIRVIKIGLTRLNFTAKFIL